MLFVRATRGHGGPYRVMCALTQPVFSTGRLARYPSPRAARLASHILAAPPLPAAAVPAPHAAPPGDNVAHG